MVAALDPSKGGWRTSSRSGTNGNCVEVRLAADAVAVRDARNKGIGPTLTFSAAEWAAFIAGAKDGEFDL